MNLYNFSCTPKNCPANSLCPQGSVDYIPCDAPFYYVKYMYDSSCTLTYKFYLLVCGLSVAFLILIVIAVITVKKKNSALFSRIKNQRLLLDSKDPTYHGY